MKLLIRYFFKLVHAIVGPILLGLDALTRPRPVKRSEDAQRAVDAKTANLVMYQFLTCPFCIKARRAIHRLALNIETRDALRDPLSREELLKGGGQIKVPCLRITREDGSHHWLYESDDIVAWLDSEFT